MATATPALSPRHTVDQLLRDAKYLGHAIEAVSGFVQSELRDMRTYRNHLEAGLQDIADHLEGVSPEDVAA